MKAETKWARDNEEAHAFSNNKNNSRGYGQKHHAGSERSLAA